MNWIKQPCLRNSMMKTPMSCDTPSEPLVHVGLVEPDPLEGEAGDGRVLEGGPHGADDLQPVGEAVEVLREEGRDRVAVVGPVRLRLSEGVDHDQAGLCGVAEFAQAP